mmetsp:Transcript_21936/g.43110  ORF Transcript_21936/g.43110 Transcript_21936/m.43110 type:complete len:822 (-) Transcript_21936:905-3370(-)
MDTTSASEGQLGTLKWQYVHLLSLGQHNDVVKGLVQELVGSSRGCLEEVYKVLVLLHLKVGGNRTHGCRERQHRVEANVGLFVHKFTEGLGLSLCGRVILVLGKDIRSRVVSDHDTGFRAGRASRETLPELFGNEGHERVHETHGHIESPPEHIARKLACLDLLLGSALLLRSAHHRLECLHINVTQVVIEEAVHHIGHLSEIKGSHALVGLCTGVAQGTQDPAVAERQRQLTPGGTGKEVSLRLEVVAEVHHAELGCLPDLVAETTVSSNQVNVEVEVTGTGASSVVQEAETECIGTALRNSVWVGGVLSLLGLLNLVRRQVGVGLKCGVHGLESDAIDDLLRGDDISETLGHLASEFVAHHRVQEHLAERKFLLQLQTHHHHTGNPEEEDIVASLEKAAREERLKLLSGILTFLAPTNRAKREESRRVPSVEDVGVLFKLDSARVHTKLLCGAAADLVFITANEPFIVASGVSASLRGDNGLVGRDPVAPPELTAHTPVLNVLKPVEPCVFCGLWNELELLRTNLLNRLSSHGLAVNPPLRLEARLNHVAGTAAYGNLHGVRLLITKETCSLELLFNNYASIVAHEAFKGCSADAVDRSIVVKDRDFLKVVTAATCEIVRVMRRGDLDGSSSEGHINKDIVGDDWDCAVAERVPDLLAMEVCVPRIFRVHSHGSISEHRLKTGSRHYNLLIALCGSRFVISSNLVRETCEGTELILLVRIVVLYLAHGTTREIDVVYLNIRERCGKRVAPVDKASVTVDEAILVHLHKSLSDALAALLVHGEDGARMVDTSTKDAKLGENVCSVGLLPLPNLLEELLAA